MFENICCRALMWGRLAYHLNGVSLSPASVVCLFLIGTPRSASVQQRCNKQDPVVPRRKVSPLLFFC